MDNCWIFPKYRFDDNLLIQALEYFKNDGRAIMRKSNEDKGGSGSQYGHDILIKDYPDLVEFKEHTINKLAKEFIDYYELDVEWMATFFEIDENCFFNWHKDSGGYHWPKPSANFMYCIGECSEESRAKIIFKDDSGSISQMPVYKAVVFNPQIEHAVDNRNYPLRINFRFPMYGKSFDYIYNQIRFKDESS
jgi:hypothetical protein